MGVFELVMIAVGLSMDAFAVSLCKGVECTRPDAKRTFTIALFFGVFQAVMPLIGWGLGRQFEQYIVQYDHWIAFILLSFIGGKMAYEALRGGECETCDSKPLNIRDLTMLAIATSIDALAVGITFAFFQMRIVPSVLLIGIITFAICAAGVMIGSRFGARFKSKAELVGGVVLILIGLKILLEHTGIMPVL